MALVLEPGTEVARYRLERRIGRGGMGEVWQAHDGETRRRVALKFIRDPAASPHLRKRFLREVRAASAVRHPSVVKIHDVIELDDGSPVMVMEFLEGESLAERMQRKGPLELREAAAILLPVVSAVGTAHALGIVHRDLKPENIFLSRALDGSDDIRVLDFGIAKLTNSTESASEGLTTTGAVLGTPCYMAPEQAFGEKDTDHRADVWALGVIAYEMLTGMLPTKADNPGQVLKIILTRGIPSLADAAPDLPAEITLLVDRMVKRDRAERLDRLEEVQEVLAHYADAQVPSFGAPVPPDSARFAELAQSIERSEDDDTRAARDDQIAEHPRSRLWLVAVAVAAAGVAAGALLMRDQERDEPLQALIPPAATTATAITNDPEPTPLPPPEPTSVPTAVREAPKRPRPVEPPPPSAIVDTPPPTTKASPIAEESPYRPR